MVTGPVAGAAGGGGQSESQVNTQIDTKTLGYRTQFIQAGSDVLVTPADSAAYGSATLNAGGVPVAVTTMNHANSGSTTYSQWSWMVPNSCDVSSALAFRMVWAPSDTNTNGMAFNWRRSFAGDGETMPTSAFGAGLTDVPLGVANDVQIGPWASQTVSGLAVGDFVNFRFYRISGDAADTYTGIVQVLGYEFRYTLSAAIDD